jgi:DNA-binding PadR family transcriptional regulator
MSRVLGTSTIAILAALKGEVCYGLDLTERTGLAPGSVYTTLRRLEDRKFIEGRWEPPAIAERERRPRRRYYTLTREGLAALEEASAHLSRLARGVRRQVTRSPAR